MQGEHALSRGRRAPRKAENRSAVYTPNASVDAMRMCGEAQVERSQLVLLWPLGAPHGPQLLGYFAPRGAPGAWPWLQAYSWCSAGGAGGLRRIRLAAATLQRSHAHGRRSRCHRPRRAAPGPRWLRLPNTLSLRQAAPPGRRRGCSAPAASSAPGGAPAAPPAAAAQASACSSASGVRVPPRTP